MRLKDLSVLYRRWKGEVRCVFLNRGQKVRFNKIMIS